VLPLNNSTYISGPLVKSQPPPLLSVAGKRVTSIFETLILVGVIWSPQLGPEYPSAQSQSPFTHTPPFKQVTFSQGFGTGSSLSQEFNEKIETNIVRTKSSLIIP